MAISRFSPHYILRVRDHVSPSTADTAPCVLIGRKERDYSRAPPHHRTSLSIKGPRRPLDERHLLCGCHHPAVSKGAVDKKRHRDYHLPTVTRERGEPVRVALGGELGPGKRRATVRT